MGSFIACFSILYIDFGSIFKLPEMQLHTIPSLTWDITILHFLIMMQNP